MTTTSATSTLFKIPTQFHNQTGFWGTVDANHQFCEPHYAVTPYLAEPWNAVSSLVFCVAAWAVWNKVQQQQHKGGVLLSSSDRRWILAGCYSMVILGLGSFLFHATMRRPAQLLDEIPMILFVAVLVLAKVDKHPWLRDRAMFHRLWLGALHVGITMAYVVNENYDFFVHSFTFLVLIEVAIATSLRGMGDPSLHTRGLLAIIVGKMFWEMEHRLCDDYPAVWVFHVVWHVLSSFSTYYGLLYLHSLDEQQQRKLAANGKKNK